MPRPKAKQRPAWIRGYDDPLVRRFERYVETLSDNETLELHRIVCRRAAGIFGPMFQQKRDENWRQGMIAGRSRVSAS